MPLNLTNHLFNVTYKSVLSKLRLALLRTVLYRCRFSYKAISRPLQCFLKTVSHNVRLTSTLGMTLIP